MTSFKTPTPQQIEVAVQRMRSPDLEAYIFSRLENPKWVAPLNAKGIFKSPPPAVPLEGGGSTYPHWPPSRYLAKMAKHVPEEVAGIFSRLQTENIWVIGDILDASQSMSANEAVTLVPAVSFAARKRALWVHFKDASALCARLAREGKSAAMDLADALFEPQLETGKDDYGRNDDYWYKDGLTEALPSLVERMPRETLIKLCEWLKKCVDAKKHADAKSGWDYSYAWRPAIEEHEQNRDFDFAGIMVGFVRHGFEQAIHKGQVSLEGALKTLSGYGYLVFSRIRVHLINEFGDDHSELARKLILDHELFDDVGHKHEYAMLAARRLGLLKADERKEWFKWIDDGPDLRNFRGRILKETGREATEAECLARKQYWQFEKLHCVRKHLDGERRRFYEDMLAKHGEPELADLNSRISVGSGRQSPMNVEDLTKLTFEQAVAKVTSWVPGEREFMGPDIDDLAFIFGKYLAIDPTNFSAFADILIGRQPIYVRTFIHEMGEAVKTGREINVLAVLRLGRWVVEQPGDPPPPAQKRGHPGMVDHDWKWTRSEISRFIEALCEARVNDRLRYSMEGLRDKLWTMIEVLCRDPVESQEVVEATNANPRLHDYLTMGINSARGKAVGAAMEYARWLANHLKKDEGKGEFILGGFESMPEVQRMLDWLIAPENRSFGALAVVGSNTDLIYWIDRAWLGANADRLFNLTGIEKDPSEAHGWAAWNAFLVWVRPHVEYLTLFKSQFIYAVEQSSKVGSVEKGREQPLNHLGEHLVMLYGRGQLALEDGEGLFKSFLTTSHPDLRRHAIGFICRTLEGKEKVPKEVLERFQVLWDAYWGGVGKQDAKEKPGSWLFGGWFASGKFPDQWALESLDRFLEVALNPEPYRAILEQLARVAQIDIARAVRVLDIMARGDKEGWRIHGSLDPVRQVLEKAMVAGGEARSKAEKVINFLGRRGHTSLGDLLRIKVSE